MRTKTLIIEIVSRQIAQTLTGKLSSDHQTCLIVIPQKILVIKLTVLYFYLFFFKK